MCLFPFCFLFQKVSKDSPLSCSGSRSSKTFKPKKNIPEGSHQYELLKHAEATLGSGNLRMAVMLPEGEDLNEWVAVNSESLASSSQGCWKWADTWGRTAVCPCLFLEKRGVGSPCFLQLSDRRMQPGGALLPGNRGRVTGDSLKVQLGHPEEFLHGKRCQALEVLESPSLEMSGAQLDMAVRWWGSATG